MEMKSELAANLAKAPKKEETNEMEETTSSPTAATLASTATPSTPVAFVLPEEPPREPLQTVPPATQNNQASTTKVASLEKTVPLQPRGGAFMMKPQLPKQTPVVAVPPTVELGQRWKPLYQVFTHIPPKEGPQPMPTRNNVQWGLGRINWLKRVPLIGNLKRQSL